MTNQQKKFLEQHGPLLSQLIKNHLKTHPQSIQKWEAEDTHGILIALSNSKAFYEQDFYQLEKDVSLIENKPEWFEAQIKAYHKNIVSLTLEKSRIKTPSEMLPGLKNYLGPHKPQKNPLNEPKTQSNKPRKK